MPINEPLKYFLKNRRVYMSQIKRYIGNFHDAEDAFSEIAKGLFQKGDQFDGKSSVSSWLRSVVRNTSINYATSLKRQRGLEVDDALYDSSDKRGLEPVDYILREESRNLLVQEMNGLDEVDRSVLIMHYIEGKSYLEIGNNMDTTEDAAKIRAYKARRKLRGRL